MLDTKKTIDETEAGQELAAMRELAAKAVAECQDADLLDLVYKLIVQEGQA